MTHNLKTGDEVIWIDHEDYDIMTVLRICEDDTAECFEYNPQHAFKIKVEELETL